LTADGHLTIKNAEATVPAGTLKGAGATLDFKGNQVSVTSAAGDWNGLAWTAAGTVTASDVRASALDLAVKLPEAPLSLGAGIACTASLDLHATGQPHSLALSGSAQLLTLALENSLDMEGLVTPGASGLAGPLPALAFAGPPAWKLDVQVGGNAAVTLANSSGTAAPALEISGSIAQPSISGSVDLKNFTISEGPDKLTVADGTFYINQPDPASAVLALHATGVTAGDSFDGYLFGTLADKYFTWPPAVTAALAGHPDASSLAPFSSRPLALDPAPPAAAPAPAPATSPAPAKP